MDRKQLMHKLVKDAFNAGSSLAIESIAKVLTEEAFRRRSTQAVLLTIAAQIKHDGVANALAKKADEYADVLIEQVLKEGEQNE